MKFLDEAKIYLKSGDGGAGAVSFRREKFVEFGGPDGGNGGRGGAVIFRARADLNTLIDFRYKQHFKAPIGGHGMGRDRSGAAGEDVIIDVPVGTQILDEDREEVLADMLEDGQTLTFLTGGDGGFGNAHFKTSTNRAPRKNTPGWPGEEMWVWLRLKLIADAGLVGLPNAGKSTFLAAVSAARPKIADYPFTTLAPNLGVVTVDDRRFVLADIPGLIEGAAEGAGLGTRFLGHVERTAVLIHLVDGTAEDVATDYHIIREELAAYGAGLEDRPTLLCLNKTDALDADTIAARVAALEDVSGQRVHAISGVAGTGLTPLKHAIADHVARDRAARRKDEAEEAAPAPVPPAAAEAGNTADPAGGVTPDQPQTWDPLSPAGE